MREIALVGAGGLIGAVARFLVSGWVHRWLGAGLPWGTLVVNVTGCFLVGMLMAVPGSRVAVGPELRLLLGIGILGSFTTFSTFGYETVELLRRGEAGLALANAGASVVLGFAAVVAGALLVRWLAG